MGIKIIKVLTSTVNAETNCGRHGLILTVAR